MRLWILSLPLLLVASAEATAESAPVKLRQYQHQEGRSLKDYIDDGYEIKAVLNSGKPPDHEYFLQKGKDLIMCYESSTMNGGEIARREMFCSTLVRPNQFK